MRIWKILISLLISIIFIIGLCVYFFFNGNPIGKLLFKSDAVRYLSVKYPNSKIEIQNIEYSFKNNNYTATGIPNGNNALLFNIERKSKGFWDNYPQSVWAQEVREDIEDLLTRYYKHFTIRVELHGGSINFNEPFPNYSEVKAEVDGNVYIKFEDIITIEQSDLINLLEIINYIKNNKYRLTVAFSNGNELIRLQRTEIETVEDSKDLLRFKR
jgi:hypothetical protein